MEKNLQDKSILLSIVTMLQFAGIIKSRAENFNIDNKKGSSIFFDEILKENNYLHTLWQDNFKNIEIDNFSDNFATYLKQSKKIATGMDIDDNNKNIKTRLAHLISSVTLENNSIKAKPLALKEFSHNSIFPVDDDNRNEQDYYKNAYSELLKGSIKIFNQAEKDNNLLALSSAVDSLFFRYLANVPAFLSDDIVDISFYEYAKITSAFMGIYYTQSESKNIDSKEPVILIRGDFFSIQNFIFSKDSSSKNPAKSLRGKSFYVSLLSEIASIYILEELGLAYFNIMMNAAGQFVIVAYNSDDNNKKLDEIKNNIENYLYKEFYCSVSLGLSTIKCSIDDFSKDKFKYLILKMLDEKEKAKLTRFDLAKREDFVFYDYHKKFDKSTKLCSYCGVEPVYSDNEGDACDKCEKYIKLGEELTKKSNINIYHDNKDNKGIFSKYNYSFGDKNIENAVHRIHINLFEEDITGYNNCNVVHYASYVVTDGGSVRPFDKIVKEGKGAEILGVLKADVDNLGIVFSCGLSKKDSNGNVTESNITFSKTNMLSRSIHNFFSYYLSYLMKEENLNVYTVFAGGDDLFIVGKYNDIVKLAMLMNKEFNRFTGNNEDITISAGIGLFKTGVPIWFMAEETEELLEESKKNKIGKYGLRKGNISLLYTTCKYDEFMKWYDEFYNKFPNRENDYPKSFYYKVMQYCDMEAEYQKDNKKFELLMWRSRLNYNVTRMNLEKSVANDILTYLVEKIEDKGKPLLLKSLIALKLYDIRNIK